MDIVFMGTSAFAVPSLERLLGSHHTLLAVVTQPDRPQGRGQKLSSSPVKQAAIGLQVRLLQPLRAGDADFLAALQALKPEIIVVTAYGQLLPPPLLAIPPRGCVNVHASLLPKYRGAAPINWALIRGERVTGVTIMSLDATLDTGPILSQCQVEIDGADNAQTLHDRLALLGADELLRTLDRLESDALTPRPQDHRQATYAPKLRKEDGIIRWEQDAVDLANLIRGVTPWPGAVTTHDGRLLRIWSATPVLAATGEHPGRIAKIDQRGAWVETGDGYLVVEEVQPAGGRRMDMAAYVRGHALRPGDEFQAC